jgi:hypothetical protein
MKDTDKKKGEREKKLREGEGGYLREGEEERERNTITWKQNFWRELL